MLIKLKSTNNDLGYIISKNPNSGMLTRNIRTGVGICYFENNNENVCVFNDNDLDTSFGGKDKGWLNVHPYTSPMAVLTLVNTFYNSGFKSRMEEDVDNYTHSFEILNLEIMGIKVFKRMLKHIDNFSFDIEEINDKIYNIKISTDTSIFELLNLVNLLMIILSDRSDDYVHKDERSIEKYIKTIERLNSNFYVKSLFTQRMLNKKDNFDIFKDRLNTDGIELGFRGTHEQRFEFIKTIVKRDKPILDIGSGTGFYTLPFGLKTKMFSIEKDDETRNKLKYLVKMKNIKDVTILKDIAEYNYKYGVDVLLTEVIEHMDIKEARELIEYVLKNVNFKKFVITTPNRDFNVNYLIEDGFRHDDHKFEMSKDEFNTFINELELVNLDVEFIDIGDKVNDISTTIGVVFTNINDVKLEDTDIKEVTKKKLKNKNKLDFSVDKLKRYSENKIRFISGTMSPSSSNKNGLETLENALEHYKKRGIEKVTIQDKYMGSRLQIYVFKDSNKNYAVSRKGWRIDLEKYTELKEYLVDFNVKFNVDKIFNKYNVDYFILDGELEPWLYFSRNYINSDFRNLYITYKRELELLNVGTFNSLLLGMKEEYNSGFNEDRKTLSNTELIGKYGETFYRKYKKFNIIEDFNVNEDLDNLEEYIKQVNLYSRSRTIEYKPFDILGLYKDEKRLDVEFDNVEAFNMFNGGSKIVDLNTVDLNDINEWYNNRVKEFNLEGVVVKPVNKGVVGIKTDIGSCAPYIKVRNEDYLRMVYGFNYLKPKVYEKLRDKKRTGKKVGLSISEYFSGKELLTLEIGSEEYYKVLTRLLKDISKETYLDARL